ncbi:Do family serine endopeptidase [Roseiconus nitratireducens]|uniref:Do family serine endopeptidase n=1 Tax=Roseiconus nitratireducens TaxID=2605748 RepID=A0A5M6D816_9BACT|nr:Do family serine endopeptidase [Roseiconus nitratireducens]KAA5542630.1 Do family serine endopeptidase [Roseiconus nitratireducens]
MHATRKPNRHRKLTALAATLALVGAGGVYAGTEFQDQKPSTQQSIAKMAPEVKDAVSAANDLSTAFRAVSQAVLPAVVAIETRPDVAWQQASEGQAQPSADPFGGRNPFQGTPLEDMFEDGQFRMQPFRGQPFAQPGPQGRSPRQPMPRGGIGSGVIIDPSGIILTNNHVVAGGGRVTVKIHDGREFEASNVWTDPSTDIAVVQIEDASGLVAAPLGDSDNVAIGDWVLALGQPFGLESTVTAGIISAMHRGIGITDRENFLQTDAAINPGNSGGPLVNLRGEIVGINTAIHSRGGGNDGIGFAVPSNMARWVSDQLRDGGKVRRAYLGVGIQPVTQELAKEMRVQPRSGVVVTDVYPDTPAAKSGLQSGDVIVKFGGKPVTTPQELQLLVERSKFGETVTIDINRDGESVELRYEPTERPGDFGKLASNSSGSQDGARLNDLGMAVATLTDDVAKKLGVKADSGVVITMVKDGGAAAQAGLEPGMVVTAVNRKSVSTIDEFKELVKESDDDVLMLVRTDAGSRFVVVKR